MLTIEASSSSRRLRRESLRKKQRRCQVDGNRPLEARGRKRFDIVGLKFAGVVDQKSELAKCRRCGNKPAHGIMVGEIGKNNAGASAAPVIASASLSASSRELFACRTTA